MAVVRVLQEIQVSPSPPLPSQPPQPLSFLDAVWTLGFQVERLFFYDFPHPISHFMDTQLSTFITSLSLVLRSFYPLAGAIRCSLTSEDQLECIYTEGDSVTITVAVLTGEDFRDMSGHNPRDINKLRQLVPRTPKLSTDGESSLLSVQVTLFPDQGLCIGFTVNHAACDGTGSMQFIRSWAAACRSAGGIADVAAPFLDRSVIVDNRGMYQRLFQKVRKFADAYADQLKEMRAVKSSSPYSVYGTFTLGKDQIALLKKQLQARAVEKATPPFHISAFVVTCAYVWRCLVKARRCAGDGVQYLSCVVDWRQRMRPPIPRNYFGNCLGSCMTDALQAGKIAGTDGFEVAAMAIGKTIDELQGKDVGEIVEAIVDKYVELAKHGPLSVAGSPKLRVYETDFGWGRPVKVEVTSIAGTGAMSLAESPAEEGGIEIGLVLAEEEMKEFGKNFAGGLPDTFI